MQLNSEEQAMLAGEMGPATRKAMEILLALGKIFGAERMLPVSSVQISGVSYDNLGDAGLEFLSEMASGDGRARVLTTLNPAGMDTEAWQSLGIPPEFAAKQEEVIAAFGRMNVVTTCTCTPYLAGNLPLFGEHLAWSESSAVCFANSILGARTNREGGPSALAAALTGRTPDYGFHQEAARRPTLTFDVPASIRETSEFGALGVVLGKALEASGSRPVPYLRGLQTASLEGLKSFCASLATYGGAALFHIQGLTPEAERYLAPDAVIQVTREQVEQAAAGLLDPAPAGGADFYSLGCPHLSLAEIARLAGLLQGKHVRHEFWVTTARPVKQMADRMGYTAIIEASGAKFAADTCCVVAPIAGRFKVMVTDSAKACYYAASKNRFQTRLLPFEQVVAEALQ